MLRVAFYFAVLAGAYTQSVVIASEPAAAPSFRRDVMAVLSRAGCNQGTCHGNANGKGGLKLSLRGQDPDADYFTLTRRSASRRVTPLDPDGSLLLQKPLMLVPHEGGRRFSATSRECDILRRWITAGASRDSDSAAHLVTLKVSPPQQTIYAPEHTVQFSVVAQFSDGQERDVTHLAVFESSAPFVAVSDAGLASSQSAGMTTVTVRYLHLQQAVRLEFVSESNNFAFAAPEPRNFIDANVFDQLRRLRINPSGICDDTTFVRRVFLDLTGLLPTAEEARAFVESDDTNKRAILIDRLLASEEFNDLQALRWADLLRVEEKTLDKTGVKVFHEWIRKSFADNKPLNQFVAEIVAARGSTYKVPPTNFYRALRKPEHRAESSAQVFLGIRLQCAKCHHHPFDQWTQDDYYSWSNFFGRIDYEILENKRRDKNDKNEFAGEQIVKLKESGDVKNPTTGQTAGLRFLGAESDDAEGQLLEGIASVPYLKALLPDGDSKDKSPDRLHRLAAWLTDPANDRFATTQANRIWAQLLGQGVIDPVDDFRSTNPPSNPALLKGLTEEFRKSNFDVRHLMRLIANSATYQLASVDGADVAEEWNGCFAQTKVRRLTAEQTLDGISRVLGVAVKFGGHDLGTRAVQLVGVRNGGHRYSPPEIGDRFLKLFGKPNRLQTCECERTNQTTLAQTFEMVSGDLISELMNRRGNRIENLVADEVSDADAISDIYWTALSRPPTANETEFATAYITKSDSRRHAFEDLTWALLNSNEFLLRR